VDGFEGLRLHELRELIEEGLDAGRDFGVEMGVCHAPVGHFETSIIKTPRADSARDCARGYGVIALGPGVSASSSSLEKHDLNLLTRLFAATLLSALVACGVVTQSESYDNGQFRVLPGASDKEDQWEGPWLFLNRDGSVMYQETIDGESYDRTGFYSHGSKTRDLTESEIEQQRQRIAEYLRRTGGRSRL
jgi:hypothetical protein